MRICNDSAGGWVKILFFSISCWFFMSNQVSGAWFFSASLELVKEGKSDYVIVLAEPSIASERFAAEELRRHLEQSTQAQFDIIAESEFLGGTNAIFVGHSEYARHNSIDLAGFTAEEWLLQSKDKNIILTGGRPRGSLYAVYEFLGTKLGWQWFDAYNSKCPHFETLRLRPFKLRGKPAFPDRHIYSALPASEADDLLRTRNKDTRPKSDAKYGFGYSLGTHTFYRYSSRFPADKPEYLALDRNGERPVSTSGHGPGQICLSNMGARQSVLEQLRLEIAEDYALAAANAQGQQPSYALSISQNDTHWICSCESCQALSRDGQSDSAALLDFINYLALQLRQDFPDVLLETWAYANTIKPPVNRVPADNVLIRVIQLNGEWAGDAAKHDDPNWQPAWYPDFFRSRNHVNNRAANKILLDWSKISKHLGVWDYWILYHESFYTPYSNVQAIYENLRLYQKLGLERVFVEFEASPLSSFYSLKTWLGWKLMQNPRQSLPKLLDLFMDSYYGAAAKPMRDYLEHLEGSIAAVPAAAGNLSSLKTSQRPYLTLKFYEKALGYLALAEELSAGQLNQCLNVKLERIIVGAGLYVMWEKLASELPPGTSMPWESESILAQYERDFQEVLSHRADLASRTKLSDLEKNLGILRQKKKSFMLMQQSAPSITVPRLAKANGDGAKVDWTKAVQVKDWRRLWGETVPERELLALMAHDGEYLYMMLEESALELDKLSEVWWGGDGWEIFFSNQEAAGIYRQLALNCNGEYKLFEYNHGSHTITDAVALSMRRQDGSWRSTLAIPLSKLLPRAPQAGQDFSMNIFRQTRWRPGEHMCWSPIFEAGYHDLERLGRVHLEP